MIAFEKMHGNGNDFVVIDALTSNIAFSKAFVKRMAHRKLGVGFDQLIVIYPPKKKQDDFFIKFFNADGSQAGMCMNGLRCVAYFIWKNKLAPKKILKLGTKTKSIEAKLLKDSMIQLSFDLPKKITLPGSVLKFLEKKGFKSSQAIDVGNKHLILRKTNLDTHDLANTDVVLRKNKFLSDFNISIIKITKNAINVRTSEHGAGETLACGSAAASISFAYGKDDAKTTLKFRGGKITTIKAANMKLIGPAVKLFEGRWES